MDGHGLAAAVFGEEGVGEDNKIPESCPNLDYTDYGIIMILESW
jgi:hypothetical protein